MITLYSGIPRSGKTYKMVYDLNDVKDKYFVIHNIDGLRPGFLGEASCYFVQYCTDQKMEVIDFFSKEYQVEFSEAVRAKYNKDCLVIIDESHEWFSKNKKQLMMWMSYHGHLNQTVWLVAHRSTNLSSVYRSFIEVEYRAKSGTFLFLPGYFIYNRILGGVAAGFTFTRKKQEIFDIYKSQNFDYVKKSPSLLIPIVLSLCAMGVVYFLLMPGRVIGKGHVKNVGEDLQQQKTQVMDNINEKKATFRFAGVIGESILLQDLESGKFVDVKELDNQYLVMLKSKNYLKLFDIKNKKLLVVSSYERTRPANLEPEASAGKVKK